MVMPGRVNVMPGPPPQSTISAVVPPTARIRIPNGDPQPIIVPVPPGTLQAKSIVRGAAGGNVACRRESLEALCLMEANFVIKVAQSSGADQEPGAATES